MLRTKLADELRRSPPVVLPSMLLCNFGHLDREIHALEISGARALHLDVMDGQFVPNITYGMTIVEAARQATKLPLDVHLMIADPARYIDAFADAGADVITIHAEAVEDARPVLEQIRRRGKLAGLALNPPTPLEAIAPVLDACDMVLVMSVMPGFGGQAFDPRALDKLRSLRASHGDRLLLEVDGGVNEKTAAACGQAGAQMLVTGAAIFRNPGHSYAESLAALARLASPN